MTKNINLLKMIQSGEISNDIAQEILDKILDSPEVENIQEILGFSKIEWTAYMQGADPAELSQWRADGWPNVCVQCGASISLGEYGWFTVSVGPNGKSYIKHVVCPSSE